MTALESPGLRAALIGCGGMGRGHARLARQLGIEVIGYCDVIEAAAVRACEELGGQYATADAGRIMRDDRIDLLFIATQHDGHHPLALAGARAGKHMLLEKPMCLDWPQAVEVTEAVERAGVKMVINHKFRISPVVQMTRALIPHPRVSHGHLAMNDSSGGPSAWLWRADDGGGLTLSTASHTVDLLMYLMGSHAERVYAEGRLFQPGGKGTSGYPDGLVGTIAWQSGAISTFLSTDQGQNAYTSKFFVQLADGQRSVALHDHIQRAEYSGCEIDSFDARELPEEQRQKASLLVNLLEAIHTGGETLCPPRDASHVVAICSALETAARTGQPQLVQN